MDFASACGLGNHKGHHSRKSRWCGGRVNNNILAVDNQKAMLRMGSRTSWGLGWPPRCVKSGRLAQHPAPRERERGQTHPKGPNRSQRKDVE